MGQSIRHLSDEFPEITVQDFKVEKINIPTQSLVIDFSSPDYLSEILHTCVDQKLPLVIGTTGLNSNHHELIGKAKNTIPILMGSNMSVGIATLKKSITNIQAIQEA